MDILLTHLHMDHIQGLGFFAPLYRPDLEVHIWGPGSTTLRLQARLMRYLSPPLFPVSLSELPCKLTFHEVPCDEVDIGEFRVMSRAGVPPGPDGGIPHHRGGRRRADLPARSRTRAGRAALSVACRGRGLPAATLAAGADLLIHDGQYSAAEYPGHCGWGHSSLQQTLDFGR